MHKNVFFLYLINWCSNWLQSVCQNDVCSFWQRLLDLLQTSQQNLTWKLSVTLQRNVKVYKERKNMWETCGVQRGKPQMPDNKSHMRNDIVWVGTVTSLWIHHLVSAIMRHPDAKKTWAICVCKYLNPSPFILAHWMIALHSGRSFFWHRWFPRFTLPFSQRHFIFFIPDWQDRMSAVSARISVKFFSVESSGTRWTPEVENIWFKVKSTQDVKTFWGKLTVILKVQSAAYKEVTQLEY